jgi:hypothetical protein
VLSLGGAAFADEPLTSSPKTSDIKKSECVQME